MATSSLYWKSRDAFERARIAIAKRRTYLIENHHEIAEKYRRGASLSDLAQEYFPQDYKISPNIPKNAVLGALDNLLDPEEKIKLGLRHKRDAYKKRKDRDHSRKKRKNPLRVAAGKRSYQVGLSKFTSEDLARYCINRMIQKGIFPYEGEVKFVNTGFSDQQLLYPMNERQYILYLRDRVEMTWPQIEDKVNREFCDSKRRPRRANSIRVVYQNWKKEDGPSNSNEKSS
jgi:hypothetical protein